MCCVMLGRVCAAAGCRLMKFTAASGMYLFQSDAVDLYNSASGTWSTARLSARLASLAATSVGNVAIFAGGLKPSSGPIIISNSVDLYNSASGAWSTAQLSSGRWKLAATSVGNVAIFAGGETGVLWRVCVGVVVR